MLKKDKFNNSMRTGNVKSVIHIPLVISFIFLLFGNWFVAEWATTGVTSWLVKIIFYPILYLYLPIGAFYYIVQHDPIENKFEKEVMRFVWIMYVAYPACFVILRVVFHGEIEGAAVLMTIPIVIGTLAALFGIAIGLLCLPFNIESFYRVLIGSAIPQHPAYAVIMSDRVISPSQAVLLASEIEESLGAANCTSTLALNIRSHRAKMLLDVLKEKVDFAAERNRRREAEREAEIERRTRPERERLAAQVRAARLDAELADKMVELIRENERRKYMEEN